MSEKYFIRLRGKQQGPFDADKLRVMARRGQFSRSHEISPDGVIWSPAQSVPQLFAQPATTKAADDPFVAASASVSAKSEQAGASSAQAAGHAATAGHANGSPPRPEIWYYAYNGSPQGPVDFQRLAQMFAGRQLPPETQVWKDGSPDWIPASTVPGLLPPVTENTNASVRIETGEARDLGAAVIRVLDESRPWVQFLGVYTLLLATGNFVWGIVLIVIGSRTKVIPVTLSGILNLGISLLIGFGGYLLLSYAGYIAIFVRSRREQALQQALESLKGFWLYVSLNIICSMALLVIGAVTFIAIVGSFPSPW